MSGLCEPGNVWLFGGEVWGVVDIDPTNTPDQPGKALRVVHTVPSSSGRRPVWATVPVQPVIDALLADPDTAAALMATLAQRLGRVLAAQEIPSIAAG